VRGRDPLRLPSQLAARLRCALPHVLEHELRFRARAQQQSFTRSALPCWGSSRAGRPVLPARGGQAMIVSSPAAAGIPLPSSCDASLCCGCDERDAPEARGEFSPVAVDQ
jgi:hypothetical protein